jgi:hypothetical protein
MRCSTLRVGRKRSANLCNIIQAPTGNSSEWSNRKKKKKENIFHGEK